MASKMPPATKTNYDIVNKFGGYRHKTDLTNLPPGILVPGSQNVLLNDGERVAVRQGYTLYGQANAALTPIVSAYDWETHLGTELHVRSYYDKLQFLYQDPTLGPTWTDLKTGFGDAVNFKYVDFWDTDEQSDELLFVNGSSNIYQWSGGLATFASATYTSLTLQGSKTWAELGFLTTGNRSVVLNGTTYTYQGGEDTTTLTGVSPDPSGATVDQSQTTANNTLSFGTANTTTHHAQVAQSFTPTNATLTEVVLQRNGDIGTFTGTVTIDIEADAAGIPSGVSLGSVTISNADWVALPSGAPFSVVFSSPISLIPLGTYWIKLSTSTNDNSNHPNLGVNSAGGYGGGQVKFYNTTDGWTSIATIDCYFLTITGSSPPTVGSLIFQSVNTIPNSATTGLPSTFSNDLIGILYNQIYIGGLTSRLVYVSRVNSFTNYSFSSPRLVGEGALLTLDAAAVGFIPQEDAMYITAGMDNWYETLFQTALNTTTAVETLTVNRLQTAGQAAAQSQALISKIKNYVFFVSNEPSLDTLGKVELIDTPQSLNISDPIKLDFDNYDFTGGQCYYFQNYIYIALPAEGKVLMFSMARGLLQSQSATTLSSSGALVAWEAPQILPISCFSTINGELYGHSSQVAETYKLFTGYNDNGNPIDARALFSYQNEGDRATQKNFNQFYNEGYISTNTTLYGTVYFDYGGADGTTTFAISGTDTRAVLPIPDTDGSLGKLVLGTRSLAGRGPSESTELPPKFRIIKTFPKVDCFEWQIEYSSNDVDQRWELLAWGPSATISTSTNAPITE